MKKLFYSLLLSSLIALCWMIIIHTLKWIAIKGNELDQMGLLLVGPQASPLLLGATSRPSPISVLGAAPLPPGPAHQLAFATEARTDMDSRRPRGRRRRRREAAATFMAALHLQVDEEDGGELRTNLHVDDRRAVGQSFETMLKKQPANGAPTRNQALPVASNQFHAKQIAIQPTSSSASGSNKQRPIDAEQPAAASLTLVLETTTTSASPGGSMETQEPPIEEEELDEEPASPATGGAPGEFPLEPNPRKLVPMLPGANSQAAIAPLPIPTPLDPPLPIGPPNRSSQLGRAPLVGPSAGHPGQLLPGAGPLIYRAPFFTSWFISSWSMLFMPVFTLISSCCFRGEDSTTRRLLVRISISQFMDNGFTTLQFLVRCALFAFLWMATIFGLVYSVSNLDATAVMALFSFSSSLTYFLSWVILHQQFVGIRIVAVIICTTGIALLAYMDNSKYLGSVLIVTCSAFNSAIYKVLYQRMFGFWSIAQMSLFFTIIGLFNALIMWPFVLLFYFLGIEIIAWRHIPWMHLSAAGAFHLTANVVSYIGPICCYDIFLTLGLLLAVGLSAVIDVSFYRIVFAGMKMGGIMLLMIGFLVCLLPENWNEYIQKLFRKQVDAFKRRKSMKKSGNKVQDMSTGQISRLRTASGRVK